MALAPVRVAAVGCGYWGPNVIRNLYSVAGFELSYVCDVDAERLEPIADRYPSARATTVEQSETLAELAAQRNLTLMVGHTFVFSPPVRKVKELIETGQIGPIYY